MGATFTPDHWAPMTWYRCVTPGCDERVDPWEHNIRCAAHRPDPAAPLALGEHIPRRVAV